MTGHRTDDGWARRYRGADLTYAEVGATHPDVTAAPPTDAHSIRAERLVGHGPDDFATVRSVILRYGMQRGAGLRVRATTETAEAGTILLSTSAAFGPIRIPCRVVYVLDGPDRAGFAYGTLPGHPESGEELFSVELRPNGDVIAVIVAFSRPGRWYTRLGGPAVRLLQAVMTRRYLAAVLVR